MQPVDIEATRFLSVLTTKQMMLLGIGIIAIFCYAAALTPSHVSAGTMAPTVAVFISAFIASLAGFAFAAISGALLYHLLPDPLQTVQIIMLCSVANQAMSVWTIRRAIDFRAMRPFLLTGAIGVPAGAFLLLHIDGAMFLRLLGGVLVIWTLYQIIARPVVLARTTGAGDLGFGFMAGVLAGFCGLSGAVISLRCGLKGWDKNRQRGVFQPCILILQIVALLCIALMRPASVASAMTLDGLSYLPVSLLGTFLGLRVFQRMTDRQFLIALNTTLMVSGLALVV